MARILVLAHTLRNAPQVLDLELAGMTLLLFVVVAGSTLLGAFH